VGTVFMIFLPRTGNPLQSRTETTGIKETAKKTGKKG